MANKVSKIFQNDIHHKLRIFNEIFFFKMFVSSRVRGPTGQEMVESRSIFRLNKITNTNEFLKNYCLDS